MDVIAELELNIEWCPKILWVTGQCVEPVGIKRDGLTNAECMERAVNEFLARGLSVSLRDELPIQTLASFSVKHDEIARLQAEVDAYLAAGGRIDVLPVCKVVSDISPAKRQKMLESSQKGSQASANTRAYGGTEKVKHDPLEGGLYASKKDAARILGVKEPYFYSSYRMGAIVIPVAKTYKNSQYFLTSDVIKLKQEREK